MAAINAEEFHINCNSVKELKEMDDDFRIFDEIMHQLKHYFTERNFECRQFFRTLHKETSTKSLSEEILWTLLELVFASDFIAKAGSFSQSSPLNTVCQLRIAHDILS
jgi:hypothetical protein